MLPRISGTQALLRIGLVGALLLAEGIVLGLRFEGPESGREWWSVVLAHAGDAVRFGIAAAAAFLLLGGSQLRERLQNVSAVATGRRRLWPLLVCHVVAFAAFFRLTALVIEGDLHAFSVPGVWVAAWVATGLVMVALAACVALAPRDVLPLMRGMSGVALTGIVVGAGAVAAGHLSSRAWRPLGRLTMSVVHAVIARVAVDPLTDSTRMMIGTQRFSVEIAPQCSGYEGIGLMGVFLGAYLWSFRASLHLPRALVLLPLGAVVAWLLNAVRLTLLIAIGTWVSPDVALGGFHSYSGWLLFCGGAFGMVAVARRSPFFTRPEALHHTAVTTNPTAVYLCPFLALVLASMATGAFTVSGFDGLYGVRVAAVGAVLWWFRRSYRTLEWTWSWRAVAAGSGVFVMWMALEFTHADPVRESALRAWIEGRPAGWAAAWLSMHVIGSVITVPIAEELAFRGFLARRLISADFESVSFRQVSWFSLLGSSLLFGAMHDRLIAGMLAGVAYALVMRRRGQLCDAVVAHATTNALIAGYVLAFGAWSLW